jgi:hypothetical protein
MPNNSEKVMPISSEGDMPLNSWLGRGKRKPESSINSNKTNDMKNNEVPEGEPDNPKGDPDDQTSGEDTLETDGGGEALEGTATLPKNEP